MTQNILAIDLGGSKLLTAVVEVARQEGRQRGNLSGIAKRELARNAGQNGILAAIDEAICETFAKTGATWSEIDKIGATIPGLADPLAGMWVYAPFSGIADFPIAAILSERYKKPVAIENDVNACALAERLFGVCVGVDDFLWITISNGIGGGLVLNGRVYPGTFGGAAEIGHFHIVEQGAPCGCGHRGCLEAEAAGPAIARRFAEHLRNAPPDTLARVEAFRAEHRKSAEHHRPGEHPLDAAAIATLARAGDTVASEVFAVTGRYVGRAAAYAANLINPACIVIGGGVSGSFDLMESAMKKRFAEEVFTGPNRNVKILKTGLGYEAGLYAAAALALLNRF